MQVDIRVPLGRPLTELADFAVLCEQAGLGGVGVPDHHHTGRDAYLALAAMALRTRRLLLYPATSNVVTRHPLVLASLVNSLDELAPGRAMLTVAPGFLSVEKAGRPQARRQRLREVVLALRGLLAEGHATLNDHDLDLYHRPATGSRVIVLASGPKLLELAGEVADGVMMLVGLDPRSVEGARAHVRRGAERAGRDPATLEEILIIPFGLGDEQAVRAWPQGWFREGQPWLRYPSASNLHWLRYAGIDLSADYDPSFPTSWLGKSARRSVCSARPSSVLPGFCGPGTKSDCGTPFSSRLTRGRVTTTFPAPRSRPSVKSSALPCVTPAPPTPRNTDPRRTLMTMTSPRPVERVDAQQAAQSTPAEARQRYRDGLVVPTTGWAAGFTQANMVILPKDWAFDMLLFGQRNPQPVPLLDVTDPGATSSPLAPDADLRTDLPRYRVWRDGELVDEPTDVTDLWRDDLVTFLIGCSFSFETALMDAGVPIRNIEQGRNVSMYRTNIECRPAGRMSGPLVVSMRPVPGRQVATAVQVTGRMPQVHGAPVHIGTPQALGITDLSAPDFGDAVDAQDGDVPVFWACGVTPQAALMDSRPPFAITHAPGHMFLTDIPDSVYRQP